MVGLLNLDLETSTVIEGGFDLYKSMPTPDCLAGRGVARPLVMMTDDCCRAQCNQSFFSRNYPMGCNVSCLAGSSGYAKLSMAFHRMIEQTISTQSNVIYCPPEEGCPGMIHNPQFATFIN